MTRLYLVRHGQAAAGWGQHHDPGLDDTGRAQAEQMAERLAPLGPLPVVTSPLARTRETAGVLAARWGVDPAVDPAVGEIPSPTHVLTARQDWLRATLRGRWEELDADLHDWRDGVVGALLAMASDTVVVTHYVAINAAVGHATGADRLVCFHPDNCSVTVVESDGRALSVVSLGDERSTVVQ